MDDAIKKLSSAVKEAILKQINSKEWIEFKNQITTAKEAGDDLGTFEVVISTETVDRGGEVIVQAGMDKKNFKNNPIVLWAHDYGSLPIGMAISVKVEGKKTIAKGVFAPTEAAQEVRKLYDAKIVRATSVGIIIKEKEGRKITESELLEFSFVPVPANPEALSLIKKYNLDQGALVQKGFIKAKIDEGEQNSDKTIKSYFIDLETHKGHFVYSDGEKKEISFKGEIADAMNFDEDVFWEKIAKIDPCYEIFMTFIDVYLRNDTNPKKFNKLLAETISLLSDRLETTEKEVGTEIKENLGKRKITLSIKQPEGAPPSPTEEVGKELAEMQSTVDSAMIEHSQEIIKIVDDLTKTKEQKVTEIKELTKQFKIEIASVMKSKGSEPRDNKAKQRSETGEFKTSMNALNGYLDTQQILRSVTTVVTKSLQTINKKIAKEKNKK